MAVFSEAYMRLVPNEGGYANVKGDRGGETYAGVSRKYFPRWEGWPIVDRNKPLKKNQKIVSSELQALLVRFYDDNFWAPIHGTNIKSQKIAEFIFDWFVISGRAAIKRIQGILGVSQDGVIGNITVGKINAEGEGMLEKLKAGRIDHVEDIIRADPSQEKFRKGWMNRINSF